MTIYNRGDYSCEWDNEVMDVPSRGFAGFNGLQHNPDAVLLQTESDPSVSIDNEKEKALMWSELSMPKFDQQVLVYLYRLICIKDMRAYRVLTTLLVTEEILQFFYRCLKLELEKRSMLTKAVHFANSTLLTKRPGTGALWLDMDHEYFQWCRTFRTK